MKPIQYGGSFSDHDQPAYTEDHEVKCALAECPNTVKRGESYSFIITLATRGPDARAGAFQCPAIEDIQAGRWHAQHFCCSMACATKAAHACLDEHIAPRHDGHMAEIAAHDEAIAQEQAAAQQYIADRAEQEKRTREEIAKHVSTQD